MPLILSCLLPFVVFTGGSFYSYNSCAERLCHIRGASTTCREFHQHQCAGQQPYFSSVVIILTESFLAEFGPRGGGSVTLNTSNPFDPPLIDPGYMTAPFDIFAMREGLRAAQRFLAAPAWKGYVLQPFGALANLSTDAEIDEFIRANAGSSAHPVGTASMSAFDAADGVVNPDLLLKRAHGLRIVDASVFVGVIVLFSNAYI